MENLSKHLGDQKFRVLFHEDEIKKRVRALADQISKDYKDRGEPLIIIGVLKGALIFIADLVRELKIKVQIEFIKASSYIDTKSSGEINILDHIPDLRGKHALIVEDIIDSGLTIKTLCEIIKRKNPSSLEICTLFEKPEMLKEPIPHINYIGFKIPNVFVIGYGLDFNQNYRELPHVVELLED